MIKRIFLIRHGATEANESHKYCGLTDVGLSKSGVFDLFGRREYYKNLVSDKVLYFTSGLKRTNETLGILFGEHGETPEHTVLKGFLEMNFGDFEGKTYDELKDLPEYREWISGNYEKNVPPNGESGEQMSKRVLDAWHEFKSALQTASPDMEDAVLVCHGGTIYFIMKHIFKDDPKSLYEWQPQNGCGYALTYKKGELGQQIPDYIKVGKAED